MHWQALDRCVAAFEMSGPARSLAHLLKYGRVRAAARVMGEDLAPLSSAVAFDVAFAIPLHRSRQRQRGFNQAALLVQAAGWPVGEGMLRPRSTRSQVGLSLSERVANMDGAFHYDGPRLDGLTVAVVDDVVTTGATADACARELKEHGARRVVALAYARTSYLREPPAGT
ncbi:MAG: ComF family protein [Dehalococcoidia bacterium]